jgi:hypothetical protein
MTRVASMLAVPVLVLAVACGGGGDDSSADSGGPGTTPSASATPAGGPSSGDFCAPDNVEVIVDGLDFSGIDVEDQIALMNPALDQLLSSAPDEIKAEVEVIVDVMRGGFQLVEEYDFDPSRAFTDGADDPRVTVLQSESYAAAAARLADFCGFDVDGGN